MYRVGEVLIVNNKTEEPYLIRVVEYKNSTLVCAVLACNKTPIGYRCKVDKIRKKLEIHNDMSQEIRKLDPRFIKNGTINYISEYGALFDVNGNQL